MNSRLLSMSTGEERMSRQAATQTIDPRFSVQVRYRLNKRGCLHISQYSDYFSTSTFTPIKFEIYFESRCSLYFRWQACDRNLLVSTFLRFAPGWVRLCRNGVIEPGNLHLQCEFSILYWLLTRHYQMLARPTGILVGISLRALLTLVLVGILFEKRNSIFFISFLFLTRQVSCWNYNVRYQIYTNI